MELIEDHKIPLWVMLKENLRIMVVLSKTKNCDPVLEMAMGRRELMLAGCRTTVKLGWRSSSLYIETSLAALASEYGNTWEMCMMKKTFNGKLSENMKDRIPDFGFEI